ncbi:hypothetical protein HS961_04630 [Comamonas piscis]|uniref:WxL domain-containing protein n=1 Tax=Comamonas piscis TaxID=1562974 RepID=A0A7G5EDV1_9BURK|nr:hypothetical protein [Comamonas piscis]QMV72176.1 hypothetical protein HS961_04630 [Comamonas piscis]WSO34928.1 hypothetical protein VUJ63_04655 [Comamonas piscis]
MKQQRRPLNLLRQSLLPLLLAGLGASAQAGSASSGTGGLPRNTPAVALNFAIQIDKFLFFRIGDGAWPTPGGTTSQVNFALSPSIPAVPTTPVNSNNTAVNWNGAAPTFSVAASGNVLPVEVRSNGGQVSVFATVTTALTSGSNTIPMNMVSVTSSDATLPAPTIPATGTGTSVNVSGGGTGAVNSLVTIRNANWTFAYNSAISRTAGNYSGQLSFTAAVP